MKTCLLVLAFILVSLNAGAFEFQIEYNAEAVEADKARIEKIEKKVIEIVKTEAFKDSVVRYNNYSCYNSKNLPRDVRGIQDVVNHIDKAVAKIKVRFYRTSPTVLGSTSGNEISFNLNNFATRSDKAIANTLFHESLHTLGYGHCGKNNIRLFPKIKRSVPYKLGDFVEKLY